MKVHEILAQVIEATREMESSTTHLMVRDNLPNSIVRAEEILSLFELRDLLNITTLDLDITHFNRLKRKEVFGPLKAFLAKRWERLKDYPQLHYTQTFNLGITKVCVKLATAMADLKIFLHEKNPNAHTTPREPLHRFELLMPGINFINSVTLLNLNLQDEIEKLELHHFILDEEFKIIHITDCLTDAKSDLSLKNTSALHAIGTKQRLSEADYFRVIYHSKAANNAWKTIQQIEQHLATINTVGGALRRLMTALRNAGISGNLGGSDEEAARDVHKGIKAFYDYFTSLSPEVQKAVYELKANENLSGLFEFIFKKLLLMAYYDNQVNALYLSDYDIENTAYLSEAEAAVLMVYVTTAAEESQLSRHHRQGVQDLPFSCVDQMSILIEGILGLRSNILNFTPNTTDVAIGMLFTDADIDLDPELTKLEAKLNAFLCTAATKAAERYTKEDVLTPRERKALYLNDNRQFLNSFSRKVISTPAHLFQCLNYLRFEYHRDFIVECLKTRALTKLFDDFDSLMDNYKLLNLVNKKYNEAALDIIIAYLDPKKRKKLFSTPIQLADLSKAVSFNLFLNILQNWLSFDFVNAMFNNPEEIRRFIAPYNDSQKLSLCNFFKILHIPSSSSSSQSSSEPKLTSLLASSAKWFKSRLFQSSETEEEPTKRQRVETQAPAEEDNANMEIVHPLTRRIIPR